MTLYWRKGDSNPRSRGYSKLGAIWRATRPMPRSRSPEPSWRSSRAKKGSKRNPPMNRGCLHAFKEIDVDGELELVETANWSPKLARKDYMIGLENLGQWRGRPGSAIL